VYEAIRLPYGGAVIAGLRQHLLAFEQQVLVKANILRWLPISIPSHTPLLHTVEESLFQYLSTLPWSTPTISLLAGGSGSVMSAPRELVHAFCYQTCHTLNWQHCLSIVSEYRPDVVLEIGPGNALAKMIRDMDSSIMARSIDEFSHDEAVLDWLERWG
jgi:[acyl-carrier-protein] S-malonyltransferase